MKIESKPLRYAHAEGHTDVCYTEDGQHIITCGHDGDVRIWVDIEDDDPNSHCVGESALAVCFKDKRLYVATDNHAVQAYTFPAFDKDGIVTRFTAPVTQIMSGGKIEALGCSSENMEARICSLEGGAPLFVMSEHKGPVLSIAICPRMKFAATASGDGVLRIWDIDTQKVVKEVTCVPKINTFYAAKVLCRMDFDPQEGKYLAYPNNREIILLDSETWGQRMAFTHSSIKCAISQTVFSPCGEYLSGSTVAGQIAVWEVRSGACMGVIDHPTSHNVSALAWNPKGIQFTVFSPCGEYLAESTVAGQIAVWEVRSGACMGVIDHPTSHNVSALAWNPKGIQFTVFSPCGEYLAESTVAGQIAVWEVRSGACMGVIDHPTSHNVSALAWNPKGIQFTVFSPCGEYLAESTVAGQIAVWEVRSGACMGVIDHPTSHNVSALA
ncbi:hypothetical protein O0L34_g9942 [Tuta absoluta]|nr:hypothetical protein O0L34_g9942 [Tuta absoluta]